MVIEEPKTLEELEESKEAIFNMMGSPFCDHLMFMHLIDRREEIETKIENLNLGAMC